MKYLKAIYFNRSVYCYGISDSVNLFRKFDLNENRWSQLALISKQNFPCLNMVIFNRNILFSIEEISSNIILYSIDIDSFSEIPFKFLSNIKFLVNAEERLYLIEQNGWIYESEIGDEYYWKQIAKSMFSDFTNGMYCSYNRGAIFISFFKKNPRNYFKFDLNRKSLIEIAYYGKNLCLKWSENKLKVINYCDQTFQLIFDHAATFIEKELSLRFICKELEQLLEVNRSIESAERRYSNKFGIHSFRSDVFPYSYSVDPNLVNWWNYKGAILCNLGIYLESIECYNNAIKIDPDNADAYDGKVNTLLKLGKHLEALDCYTKFGKIGPSYFVDCFNKGDAFMKLGKYSEAIKCFEDIIKFKPDHDRAYNVKGEALYNLGRGIDAVECYNEAIKLNSDEPMFYRNRANALDRDGRKLEALQDFNKALELDEISQNKECTIYLNNTIFD